MDYRPFLIFIFLFLAVKCDETNKSNTVTDAKSTVAKDEKETGKSNTVADVKSKEKEQKNPEKQPEKKPVEIPAAKLPSLCTVCNCTDEFVNCEKRNLTSHFEDSQWPNKSINVISFKGNSLIHLKQFPKAVVTKLILQKNKITKIDKCAFKKLINLTELDLSYNEITSENMQPQVFEGRFSPEAYEPLANLTVLNVAHNMLHSLHQDVFEHMSILKILNLSGNSFTKIDGRTLLAISSLVYLEELDLSYCGLSSLPDTLFYSLRYLKKLDLSGNMFTVPPIPLEEAKTLEYLYMDENPIKIISQHQAFPVMPKLKELSLCCMPHLTTIKAYALSGLPELEHLRVENCPLLTEIEDDILLSQTEEPERPPLKKLDLSDNALRYLPEQLVRWDLLEELDLMNNKWSCDCDNQFLIGSLLPKYGKKLMGDGLSNLTCSTPPEHAGKNMTSLSHRHLRCLDLYGSRPEKDATILVGVLVGVLLAIPVCLAIVVLWRRGFFFYGSDGPASFSRAFYKRTSGDDDF